MQKNPQKNISIKCTGGIGLESILMTQCETVFPQCFGPSKHNSINSEKHVIDHRWTCIFYILKSPAFPLKVKQQMLMLGATIGFLNPLRSLALSFLTTHSQTKINGLFHSSFILCLYKWNERALNGPWWGKPMSHTDLTINTPAAQIHWLYLPNEGERSPPHICVYFWSCSWTKNHSKPAKLTLKRKIAQNMPKMLPLISMRDESSGLQRGCYSLDLSAVSFKIAQPGE